MRYVRPRINDHLLREQARYTCEYFIQLSIHSGNNIHLGRDGQETCPAWEERMSMSLCLPVPWFSLSPSSQSGTLELKGFLYFDQDHFNVKSNQIKSKQNKTKQKHPKQ